MADDTIKIQDHILLKLGLYDKDREALGQLHFLYYSRIKRYIASCINTTTDADDLAQDVFVELCLGKGHYDAQRDAVAYLFGIARNVVGHYYRNKRKHPQTIQIDSVGEIATISEIMQHLDAVKPVSLQQFKKIIEDATSQLPPISGEAVRLRLAEGLDSKEAAKRAECSVDVFYRRFYEGLKLLKKKSKNITR